MLFAREGLARIARVMYFLLPLLNTTVADNPVGTLVQRLSLVGRP